MIDMVDSMEFWYDYPAGPNLKVFERAIVSDAPSVVQYQGTKASPYFEVLLDPKLMTVYNGIASPFQFIQPKKKCHIRFKRKGVTYIMGNFWILSAGRYMSGSGRDRRPLIKITGLDWVSGILKRRSLAEASFIGSAVGGLFGLGLGGTSKQVIEKMVADAEAIDPAGISVSMGSQIEPGVSWPALTRDMSNRTTWDGIRSICDEIGADNRVNTVSDELEVFGWRTKDTGKVYNDTHFSKLEYTESAYDQADEIAVGQGTIDVLPRERIDQWIDLNYWGNGGSPAGNVFFNTGDGSEGTKTVGCKYTGLAPTGVGFGVVMKCQPVQASGLPGFFNIAIGDIKEIRFMLSLSVTSGAISDFIVVLDQEDTVNKLLSDPFLFSSASKLYDTYIGDNYNAVGNPTFLNSIYFAVRVASTADMTMHINQLHIVLKSNKVQTYTPVYPKTNLTKIDNTIRFVGDKTNMASRFGNIMRSNNLIVAGTLNEPDPDLQQPGYTVEISSIKLDLLTPKDLRIEQIEHRFLNNRITTSFQTSEIAGVKIDTNEDKLGALFSSIGYGVATPE